MKEPKLKTVYVCSNCGETSPRWMGRCPSCGSWNTMNEDVVAEAPKAGTAAAKQAAAARPEGVTTLTAKRLSEISMTEEKSRILTGISELDRVLGGGIVLGGVVLLSGEPGVGKSTMLLQLCGAISNQHSVLYITGEESVRQVKLRAARLKVPQDLRPDRKRKAGSRGHRLHPDDALHGYLVLRRYGKSGQGKCGPPAGRGQKAGDPHVHCGPCEQGRCHCRPQSHGAYRGYGALL